MSKKGDKYESYTLPTKEAIEAVPGTPLTKEELVRLKTFGAIPKDYDVVAGGATMHKLTIGEQEFVVIMLDPPPCGCVRLKNGKKKRCKRHRQERRAARKAKKIKMVEDNLSDRQKAAELRHIEDSEVDEDKAIDGAITPDKVAVVGPAGVGVLIDVEKVDGTEVGPRMKVDAPIAGILVRGAHETPQFIPEDKVEKGPNGEIRIKKHTKGRLIKGPRGEAIFYADGQCQPNQRGTPQLIVVPGMDPEVQRKMGESVFPACEVEVNDKGMPEVKQITGPDNVPKDIHATVGVLVKCRDGSFVLVQTGGQAIGAADNAACVPTTPGDRISPGGIIGKVVEQKNGVIAVSNRQISADQKLLGTVLQGNYKEPIFVTKDQNVDPYNESKNVPLVTKLELMAKDYQNVVELATDMVQAQIQGKTVAEIQKEKAEHKAVAALGAAEVFSISLAGRRKDASMYARPLPEKPEGAKMHFSAEKEQGSGQGGGTGESKSAYLGPTKG